MRLTKLLKLFSFLCLLAAGSTQVWAGTTTYYYTKGAAHASGDGKVYASKTSDAPKDEDYAADSNATQETTTQNETHTYYFNAKANSGQSFKGWYREADCTTLVSEANPYSETVTAASTTKETPSTIELWAKFEAASATYNSAVTAHAKGSGKIFVSTDGGSTPVFDDEVSASTSGSGEQTHKYYLRALADDDYTLRFAGWYKDEACTELINPAPTYTYEVDGVEGTATPVHIYGKFEAQNPYQLINSDFEVWNSAVDEPAPGWNSFPSAKGSYSSMKSQSPYPSRVEGRTGYAVKLNSIAVSVMGVEAAKANGNLTTGYVNMGSSTPTSADNHNYTDVETKGHHIIIKGQPDAVEFWSKFTAGSGNTEMLGNAKFILHDKYNYKDPEAADPTETSHRIAISNIPITESSDWKRHEAAFSYDWTADDAAATDKYLLVNITTNINPGQSKNDELIVDDVRLIYNSELTAATYDGADVTFTGTAATVGANYNSGKLLLSSNGRGAKIERIFDTATGLLTINVKGNDYEANPTNIHTYTIQFSGFEAIETTISSPITISINGQTTPPLNTSFKFIEKKDGTYGLRMENFVLGEGSGMIPIGTLVINNLTYDAGHVTTNQTVFFEAGTLPDVAPDAWFGLVLNAMGGVPVVLDGNVDVDAETMTAKIDIDMSATLSQVIKVVAAPVTTLDDNSMIATGLQNVKLNRTFVKDGWNTICLPFEWSNAAFGGVNVEVQEFKYVENDVLQFEKVADSANPAVMEANKPYLIYLDANINDAPYYFGVEVTNVTPTAVTIGNATVGNVTFVGNYEAGKSMENLYDIYINSAERASHIEKGASGSVITVGRAYFESASGKDIDRVRMLLAGHEGETAINGVEASDTNAPIYNLQGVRDNGSRRGIYIQNGRKFVK